MGTKRVRITNLPPEIRDVTIRAELARYGEIRDIQEEKWSKAYRFVVANGIRIATITLKQHIPSYLKIEGHRVSASYEGQSTTYVLRLRGYRALIPIVSQKEKRGENGHK
jgi:hypothetical protein